MKRLEHKVALVTGAARGIGADIAQAFVAEGASVIVRDIDDAASRATAEHLGAAWLKLNMRLWPTGMPCCWPATNAFA